MLISENDSSYWYFYFNLDGSAFDGPQQTDTKKVIESLYALEINIATALLSDSLPHLHQLTPEVLEQNGFDSMIDNTQFNLGGNSKLKLSYIETDLNDHFNVVLFVNNPRTAKAVAELQSIYPEQKVLVYLIKSLVTKRIFLILAGIHLPENVILVQSLTEAKEHFEKLLESELSSTIEQENSS